MFATVPVALARSLLWLRAVPLEVSGRHDRTEEGFTLCHALPLTLVEGIMHDICGGGVLQR